jgi:outer membrane lipoprotein-sorting protein
VGAVLVAGVAAVPATARGGADPVARLGRGLASTRTLVAGVVQTRRSELLGDTETTRGRLYLRRPGDARLEYDSPSPLVILKRADTTYVYTERLAQVQVLPARAAGVPLGWVLGSSLAELRRLAAVHAVGSEVELVPHPGSGLPWRSLRLGFPAAGDFPVRFVLATGDGEEVEIRLVDLRRNVAVPASRFAPSWPRGTRRVRVGS